MKIIHHAAKDGDIDRIGLLLREGAAVDARDKHGLTGLMRAALAGQTEAVRFLLDQGAEVDGRKGDGNQGKGSTALIFAAREGHAETVRLLLDRGAAVDAVTGYGDYTALILAAMGGHLGAVDVLAERGADLDHRDAWGDSVLLSALENGHEAVVNRLRVLGASVGLAEAVVLGDTPWLIRLLEGGAIPDAKTEWGQTALMRAASRGNVDAARVLLNRGADVNTQTHTGWTALMAASGQESTAVGTLLLNAGADPNAATRFGDTPLVYTAMEGRLAMARLLARSARVTDKAFFTAISRVRVDIARLFLAHGADANATRLRGVTALMLAANTGSEDLVHLLLKHEADPTRKDDAGRTAADWALRRGHTKIAESLSEAAIEWYT